MDERATVACRGRGALHAALDAASVTFGLDGYVAGRGGSQRWCYFPRIETSSFGPSWFFASQLLQRGAAAPASGAVWGADRRTRVRSAARAD